MPKRRVLLILCFSIATVLGFVLFSRPAFALVRGKFRSVRQIASAENLLIVRAPHRDPLTYPLRGFDGVMDFEVEVLSVLRGAQRAGRPREVSESRPAGSRSLRTVVSTTTVLKPGARYLLAGRPASRGGKPWLLFHWALGLVEIPRDFSLSSLKHKTPEDQVLAILRARRAAVHHQIRALQQEKELLDSVVPSGPDEAATRPGRGR